MFAAQKNPQEFFGGAQIGNNGTHVGFLKFGQATLSTGTKSVSDAAVTANTVITVHRLVVGGTKGVSYEVVVTPGTGFVITSLNSSNATETSDTSTLGYIEVDPGPAIGAKTPTPTPTP